MDNAPVVVNLQNHGEWPKMLPHMLDMGQGIVAGCPPLLSALLSDFLVHGPVPDNTGAFQYYLTPKFAKGETYLSMSFFKATHDDGTVLECAYLDHMWTPTEHRRKGLAGRCVGMITKRAKQTRTVLTLNAQAEADRPMTDAQLLDWYKRKGFVFGPVPEGTAIKDVMGRLPL